MFNQNKAVFNMKLDSTNFRLTTSYNIIYIYIYIVILCGFLIIKLYIASHSVVWFIATCGVVPYGYSILQVVLVGLGAIMQFE